jgi:hypothetical protein
MKVVGFDGAGSDGNLEGKRVISKFGSFGAPGALLSLSFLKSANPKK